MHWSTVIKYVWLRYHLAVRLKKGVHVNSLNQVYRKAELWIVDKKRVHFNKLQAWSIINVQQALSLYTLLYIKVSLLILLLNISSIWNLKKKTVRLFGAILLYILVTVNIKTHQRIIKHIFTHIINPTISFSLLQQQLKSNHSRRGRWWLQWRCGCYIWFPSLFCFIWA